MREEEWCPNGGQGAVSDNGSAHQGAEDNSGGVIGQLVSEESGDGDMEHELTHVSGSEPTRTDEQELE